MCSKYQWQGKRQARRMLMIIYTRSNFPILLVRNYFPLWVERQATHLTNLLKQGSYLLWYELVVLEHRGITKYKQKELKSWIVRKKLQFVFLVDNRFKVHKAAKIANNFTFGWSSLHYYNHADNGRVWLLRNPNFYDVALLIDDTPREHPIDNTTRSTWLQRVSYKPHDIHNMI